VVVLLQDFQFMVLSLFGHLLDAVLQLHRSLLYPLNLVFGDRYIRFQLCLEVLF
jgi:hypothetical protein